MIEKGINNYPLVSVVMPAYNCDRYIRKAIDSILNQTYQNIEIVIADDGSTDRTRQIIDRYKDKRIKKFHNDVNLGNIRTRNKLFDLAQGDFITIQDADDWSHPMRFERQVMTLLENPELGACGTNHYTVDINGCIKRAKIMENNLIITPSSKLCFMPATIMIYKTVYKKIGGLNLYFDRLFAEDRYWIALILENYKVMCLKEPLYYYSFNPSSLTKQFDNTRKLIVTTVVSELLRQRRDTGTDWLEQNNFQHLEGFEERLLADKKWLSEQYRVFAAVNIDGLQLKEARRLLYKAIKIHPFHFLHLNTVIYLFKAYINQVLLKNNIA